MEQWNIWFDRDLWIAIGIVVVATAAIYTVLRALVGIVHKRLTTWSKGQDGNWQHFVAVVIGRCLLYTSPSPRDRQKSRMPSSA